MCQVITAAFVADCLRIDALYQAVCNGFYFCYNLTFYMHEDEFKMSDLCIIHVSYFSLFDICESYT